DRLITWFSTRFNPLTACWPGPGIRVFKFDGRLGFKSTFEVAMKLNDFRGSGIPLTLSANETPLALVEIDGDGHGRGMVVRL
ncbi:hypothetical protein Tco_1071155, partial [Tanacetum coccineum]